MTRADAARRLDIDPSTLRRWEAAGVVPATADAGWNDDALAQARVVARLRDRGHTLAQIRRATESGRLAFAFIEDLFPSAGRGYTLEEMAEQCDLEVALVERVITTLGFGTREHFDGDDLQLLRYVAAVLAAGFPLVALLQLVRVYGQALAQVADAEVRLFHLYVHEPLIRDGVPGVEIAEEMEGLARELLPLASPVMDHVHQRFLSHFLEQDIVGHMEAELSGSPSDLGRLRVAIAFADLAGYTRMTEEQGDEEAVGAVERFVESIESTLPDDARIIKTIGDGVMVVGSDPGALTDWAVGFQARRVERPLPRIGLHRGEALYRDGDYFGRDVNQAARIAARAAGGEVLVTRQVVDAAGPHLDFERIGEVRLKGFSEVTEVFAASRAEDD